MQLGLGFDRPIFFVADLADPNPLLYRTSKVCTGRSVSRNVRLCGTQQTRVRKQNGGVAGILKDFLEGRLQ